MKTLKILTARDAPDPVWEAVCLYAGECHGLPNDSYVPWSLDGEEQGGGYLTRRAEVQINEWALSQGIERGESFLFWMSW